MSVLRGYRLSTTCVSATCANNARPHGPDYFLTVLRVCLAGVVGTFISLTASAGRPIVSAAEPAAVAFPVAEAPFAAQLAGIDREWNVSFKTAGKLRVMRSGELAYWSWWRDVEAGPQI